MPSAEVGSAEVGSAEVGSAEIQPTALQEELLAMWSERLDTQHLGAGDQLFAVGGDSLTALRLVASAQRRYGVRIDRQRLFEDFTVATMATLISEARGQR